MDGMSRLWLGLLLLLLAADTAVLMGYRQVVRSSHFFVTAETIFLPLVVINVVAILLVLWALLRPLWSKRR